MHYEFVGFSATRRGAVTTTLSNLDLLERGNISPTTAKIQLLRTATALANSGYTIVWENRPFTDQELDERMDAICAGIWVEDQEIYAEFG
jgi:hypothetical protein